jgi:hypothetical protein
MNGDSRKAWVARIVGPHPTYIVEREFLKRPIPVKGKHTYELEPGVYDVSDPEVGRYFLWVRGTETRRWSKEDVYARFG